MGVIAQSRRPWRYSLVGLSLLGLTLLGFSACRSPHRPTRRMDVNPVYAQPTGMAKPNNFFHQASYGRLQVSVPEIEGAEYVNDDELCLTCHQAYSETMQHNVHRGIHEGQSCEACHGPASRHMETRGQEKGTLYDFNRVRHQDHVPALQRARRSAARVPGARCAATAQVSGAQPGCRF